jgi:hypothetical protein
VNSPKLLPLFFALLVLAAPWHCVAHAVDSLNWQVQSVSEDGGLPSSPLDGPPPSCENESGCICRGATVANGIDLDAIIPSGEFFLPLVLAANATAYDQPDLPPAASGIRLQTKSGFYSARMLRTLYSSLLI